MNFISPISADLGSTDDALDASITRATDAILAAQKSDGHWCFELEADATIPAEYVLLGHFLGEEPNLDLEAKIVRSGSVNLHAAVPSEIDLRGMDSLEAVMAAERYIDSAVMGKLNTVTIIHGKGTGALRKAVQDMLKRNKSVKSFRLGNFGEGEAGVTIVELK